MYFDLYFKEDDKYREERVYRPTTLLDTCKEEMPDFISFWDGYAHARYYSKKATLEDIENFIGTVLVAVNN